MSLQWIPRPAPETPAEDVLGKRVGGLHPLADSEGGRIISEEERKLKIIASSTLPSHSRNSSSLLRDEVRQEVLSRYTSNIPIASFITLEEDKVSEQDRARMRAERMGSSDAPSTQSNQTNLIRLIEGLDTDLKSFWGSGEKVKALRVAIQSSKLLSVNKAPHCFPSIFILVATVLDSFGDFVAERLQATAAGKSFVVASLLKRGQDANIDLIPAEAIEMCYNWFLKISSIRELLPRICIELSLLKCNKFLSKRARVQQVDVVKRLAMQIRGVADPLVACHLRWYLFMRAAEVLKADEWATIFEVTCLDSFATIEQLRSTHFEQLWQAMHISKEQYLSLFIPALQWQLDTISKHGSRQREVRAEFLQKIVLASSKVYQSSTLLLPVIRAFQPSDWFQFGVDTLLFQIDEVEVSPVVSKLKLLEAFALMVAEHEAPLPLGRAKRTALLNELWSRVELLGGEPTVDPEEFLTACSALLQLCAVHLGAKQVNVLLNVVRKFIDSHSGAGLQSAIFTLLSGLAVRLDVSALLSSKHFMTLLRHIDASGRHKLSKTLLAIMPRDVELANVALELSKTLCETYDLLDLNELAQDECTSVIVSALAAVASTDPERQIQIMCDARHALPNLDGVKLALVRQAISIIHTFGRNTKRRNAAKAYLAYCHVTIPAVSNVFPRMQASVEAAATAFLYGFVAQGEAILKLAMEFMREMTSTSTKVDGSVVSNAIAIERVILALIGLGAVTPSHAKFGHNYVLNAIQIWNDSFVWEAASTGRATVNCAIVRTVSKSLTDGGLSYKFTNCGTENYSKDTSYAESCVEIATAAATSTLLAMKAAGDSPPNLLVMGRMALELFETCIVFANIGAKKAVAVREITADAWTIANRCHTGTDVLYTRQLAAVTRFAMNFLGPEGFELATNVTTARAQRKKLQQKLEAKSEGTNDQEEADDDGSREENTVAVE
jgi:hypothetical protein